jgi:4-carboxymuconolactone decarboxylase
MISTPAEQQRRNGMADSTEPSGAQRMFGDFAPALVHFTDDVLFGEVWPRTEFAEEEAA